MRVEGSMAGSVSRALGTLYGIAYHAVMWKPGTLQPKGCVCVAGGAAVGRLWHLTNCQPTCKQPPPELKQKLRSSARPCQPAPANSAVL